MASQLVGKVRAVRRGELSAGELGEPFDISQPTASKHLRVLEEAGLLSRRVEGRVQRFRLVEKRLKEAQDWIPGTAISGKVRSDGSAICWARRSVASQLGVFVRRRFRASREEIFRALTDPERLTRWFSPSVDIGTEVLEHELRVGGRYRFGFRFPDGRLETVVGEFREVEPPGRLVFTWTWEPPDSHAGIDTLVSIVIAEMESETEVVVTHDRFPSHESRERHELGWATTLDRLEELLEERT